MPSEYQSNPMTEIALALAMAFFSIMVLAMLSMGSVMQARSAGGPGFEEGIRLSILATAGNAAASAEPVAADALIIHWRGRFYDGALEPVDPAALPGSGRRVLAIAPDLSISEAMDVRERIATADLKVTTLDARWMQTLEERKP